MNLENIRTELNKLHELEIALNKQLTQLRLQVNAAILNKNKIERDLPQKLFDLTNQIADICEIRYNLL